MLFRSAFTEGNITYCQLRNINQCTNPHLYSESSHHVDDNYEPPHLKDFDSQEEEEEEKESPLPIPGPSGTHLRILPSDINLEEQSSKSTSNRLERHFGTIMEEMFQLRTTLELE